MRDSPLFPVGSPVGPDDIVDREDYVAQLQMRLLDGKHIWVVGPRRIGKTSVVKHVLRELREKETFGAFVDLFRVASLREFVEAYANACLENESGLQKTIRALQELGGHLSPKLTYRAGDAELELALALGRRDASDEQLLSQTLDLAETIASRRNRHMVVALDEFQDVGKLGGPDLLKRMRSHFQQHTHVSYIFLGSLQTWMRDVFSDKQSQPFYRFALEYPLPEIPERAWTDYISRKFGQSGINASEEMASILVGYSGGHPMDTMFLCSELYFLMLQIRATEPTPALARIAFERCLTSLARVFGEQWESLKSQKHAQVLAKHIANGNAPYTGLDLPSQATARALRHLEDTGVLHRPRRGKYCFTEKMFAEYIRRL